MPPDRGRPDLNISLDVSKLVMEAIEKERENRYRSAEEMERAIAAVLEGRRAERERRERERVETARLAAAEAERGRQERAKAEAARLAAERTERERVQREAAEATRRTAEGAERERLQQETVAQASQAQRDRVGPPGPEHKESATTVLGRRELSRRRRIGYGIAAGALALVGFFVARSLTEKPAQDIAGIQVVPYRPAGASKMNPKDGLRYVWVPPGKFTMGCSAGDSDCGGYEKPAHQVTITKGFWLGQTEVTQAPYQRVVGTNSSYFKGADLPVEEVSWDQAQAYCQAIGGRLPTEAEGNMRRGREACRAGAAISTASRGTTATAEATPTRSRRRKRTRGGCTTCWGMSGSGRQTGTEATRRAQPLIRRDPYPGNLERCGAGLGTMVRGTRACRTVAGSSQATVTTISGCGARGMRAMPAKQPRGESRTGLRSRRECPPASGLWSRRAAQAERQTSTYSPPCGSSG